MPNQILIKIHRFFSTGTIARDNLQIEFLKLDSWSPGASFFPIATINLLSLKRSQSNFVIIKKRDKHIKTLPCEALP